LARPGRRPACKTALELDPDAFLARLYLGWSFLSLRKYEEAIKTFEQLEKDSRGHHFAKNALAVAYAITWKFNKARGIINELKERAAREYVAHTITGLAAAYLDNLDEAFEFLEKAFADRDPLLIAIKHERWVPENLREDDRFQSLIERVGFPETLVSY